MIVLTPVIMLPLLFSYTLPWVYLGPLYHLYMGFPGGSDGKASALNVGDPGSIPWSGRSPEEEKWQPTPVLLPRKFHGWRSLVGYKAHPWMEEPGGLQRVGHDSTTWHVSSVVFFRVLQGNSTNRIYKSIERGILKS